MTCEQLNSHSQKRARRLRPCRGWAAGCLGAALAILGLPQLAPAEILYASTVSNTPGIFRVDTVTNAITPVTTGTFADGVVFDSSGRLVYAALDIGEVRRFDPFTGATTTLASGFRMPLDLTLEPGGRSVLVSDRLSQTLTRIDLTTLATSTLASGHDFEGITYDRSGRLFANVADAGQVWQLDPVTGAKLNSSPTIAGATLDGLAFDRFTGDLFATGSDSNSLYRVPTSLASITTIPGFIPNPDGITSDGAGNLFVAELGGSIFQYNIGSGTITKLTKLDGLDDLAPLVGPGAPVVTPEPSTLTLFALGTLVIGGGVWRRKRRA
jgi:sugar lactone lactonase YvrE